MNHPDWDFTAWVRVTDPEALLAAAIARHTEADAEASFYPENPEEYYRDAFTDADGNIDINACLIELLDPGTIPGCEIQDSGAHPGAKE